MKLLSKILWLRNKAKKSDNLANISDMYYIPRLKELKDENIRKIVKIYIAEYNQKLLSKKIFTSLDLKAKELDAKIEMCINIILNSCIENELNAKHISLPKIHIIVSAKLKYYENIINESKNEIFARLIAIKFILQNKFISPSRKKSLKTLYNNLIISYNIVSAQEFSIKSIIENYLNEIKLNAEDKYLVKYKEEVFKIAKAIIPNFYNEIVQSNIKETSKIVMLEIVLEKYIYENSKTLKEFDYLSLENKEITEKIKMLNKRELILNALLNYGRSIITEEDLAVFYEYKFNFLCEIVNEKNFNKCFELDELNIIEYRTYEKIIEGKIENLVKGNCIALQNIPSNLKIEFIKCLKKILTLNGVFETAYILNNYSLFNLLILLETEDGLKKFFDNYQVFIYDLKETLRNDGNIVNIKDYISFECVHFLNKLLNNSDESDVFKTANNESDSIKFNKEFYELYILWRKYYEELNNKQDNFYQIPKGLVKLNLKENSEYLFINELLKKEKLILPSGLITFICDEFKSNIVLNDDLQYLDVAKWCDEMLEISPNLLDIEIYNPRNIKVIKFKNFQNSKLLKNKFYRFLIKFYNYDHLCGFCFYHSPKEVDFVGRYGTFQKIDFYSLPRTEDFNFSTFLDEIIFESNNNESIKISKNSLNSTVFVDYDYCVNFYYKEYYKLAFEGIVEKILVIIEQQSGVTLKIDDNLPITPLIRYKKENDSFNPQLKPTRDEKEYTLFRQRKRTLTEVGDDIFFDRPIPRG